MKPLSKRNGARTRLPIHQRFARGYQVGFVAGVVIAFGVWAATQSGLDAVRDANEDSRNADAIAIATNSVGATLGQIEDAPASLVLRSDLARQATALETLWNRLLDDTDRPPEVELLLSGNGGLAVQMAFLLEDIDAVAAVGATGSAESEASQSATAGRLESVASQIVDRLDTVIRSYEARADAGIADARTRSHLLFASAIGTLILLVVVLLRPLRKDLEQESSELREANRAHQAEAHRQELATHLSEGLEAAENEEEAQLVVSRAFARLLPDHKVEMLVSSSERGVMTPAVVHPVHGGPGCGVDSPWSCPAVRRGRAMTYEDSAAINACPHLAGREGGRCAATCVPISFMGQSMGVLHTTREVETALGGEQSETLGLMASQVSIRLGTLRSFAQVEMQASTDPLTGLPNRRATEERLRRLVSDGSLGSVAMADLDRFKLLNDRFGHEAGDRALRMFADAVKESLRDGDWIGRWGGEEFLLVMPGLAVDEARDALDRVRAHLADACARAEAPAVTVSIGVVDTTSAATPDDLVRFADDALLAAKTQGRDRVVPGPILREPPSSDGDPAEIGVETEETSTP